MLSCALILGLRFISPEPDAPHYNLDLFTSFRLNDDQSILHASLPDQDVQFDVPHRWRDPSLKRVLTTCFQNS